jgi:hypothetical protein
VAVIGGLAAALAVATALWCYVQRAGLRDQAMDDKNMSLLAHVHGPGRSTSTVHEPHSGTFAELEMQRVSEQSDTSTKYGLTQEEQHDTVSPKYRLTHNIKIRLREAPDIKSPETGKELQYGDTFTVDEVEVAPDEDGKTQTFLRLATGGWALEFHPTKGTRLCEVISESQIISEVQEQVALVYSEVKTALKTSIALTESRAQAADAAGDYLASVPFKKHLDVLNELMRKAKTLKPEPTGLFGSSTTRLSLAEHQDRLAKLNAIRFSISDTPTEPLPTETLPGYGQEFDMGILSTDDPDAIYTSEKFTVHKLITGDAANAAHGIRDYMGIDAKQEAIVLLRGVVAIREEFRSNGTEEQLAIVEYILDQPAKELEESGNDGHNTVLRDKGHAGMYLKDFLRKRHAVTAKLEEAHVAALRIYR